VPIEGLNRIEGGEPSEATVRWSSRQTRIKVFHAGTALKDGLPVTDGGRVLVVTTMAPRLRDAVETAYEAADMIQFEGKQMRRDIAKKALDREDPGTR
jgi:phosphoribosylamine-glycine ligase